MDHRKIVAVIPARAGSRRLKNKNVLPFGGSNLLIHKIRQLKQVMDHGWIDGVVVSSNSDEMLGMAEAEGVGTHRREEKYSDEVSAPFGEVVANICGAVECDDILWAQCTCPLTMPAHYWDAIREYRRHVPQDNDSLVAFEKVKMFLWDDGGPVNYKTGKGHVRSQDLPNLYRPTGGICIAPRDGMIEWKYFMGQNPYRFIMDKMSSVDIDDELDLECARAYYSFRRSHE